MSGQRTRPRTDVDPPRVELTSAGAYRLGTPGPIPCYGRDINVAGNTVYCMKLSGDDYSRVSQIKLDKLTQKMMTTKLSRK